MRTPPFSRLASAISLCLAVAFSPGVGAEAWERLDPEGGVAEQLVAAPGHMYAVAGNTVHGGGNRVYVSKDAAATWSRVWSGDEIVHAFAVDETDPANIYAGTTAGLLASDDGGENWRLILEVDDASVRAVALAGENPTRIHVATSLGVYVSETGGADWHVEDIWGGARFAVSPHDPLTVYLSTDDEGDSGLFVTRDGGMNWQWTSVPFYTGAPVVAPDPATPGRVLAAGSDPAGVFVSIDYGATWTELPFDASVDLPATALVFDDADPAVVYATFGDWEEQLGAVYRSSDGGESWTELAPPNAPYPPRISDILADGNDLTAATSRGIWRSSDAGENWARANQGYDNFHVSRIARTRANEGSIVAISPEGEAIMSNDGGETWRVLSDADQFTTAAIGPVDSDEVWLGRDNGQGLWKSDNAGTSWIAQGIAGEPEWITNIMINPLDPANVVVAASHAEGVTFHVTTDGGVNWSASERQFDYFGATGAQAGMSLSAPGTIYFPVSEVVFRSTNGGMDWSETAPVDLADTVAISPVDDMTLYVSSAHMPVHRSDDGGASWTRIDGAPMAFSLAIDPLDEQRLLAVDSQCLYASEDAGETWIPVAAGIQSWDMSVSDMLFDPVVPKRSFVAVEGQLYRHDGTFIDSGTGCDTDNPGDPSATPDDDGDTGGGGAWFFMLLPLALLTGSNKGRRGRIARPTNLTPGRW